MPMIDALLAEEMNSALGQKPPASSQTKGLAKSIINELKTVGLVTLAPGTVMGTAPPTGGPLIMGSASSGIIAGPSPGTLVPQMLANMGLAAPTAQITSMATAICTHLMTGTVSFTAGMVVGVCSNTVTSPGVLTGSALNGTIAGLDGGAMAQLMAAPFGGVSPELEKMCKAITDHIMKNAMVSFTMGTVLGVCSVGGGPVAAGAGTGGKIQ